MRVQQGFSLVELMVALAVLVILITVAIPSFTSSLQRANTSSLADLLITSLNYAKSEAISRNQRIYLCARGVDSDTCLNNAANWNNGWLVKLDSNDDTIRDVQIDIANASILLSDNNGNQNDERLIFRASGEILFSDGINETTPQGLDFFAQISGCNDPQLSIRRQISVALSGLISVSRVDCT
jgi:type IV fimbrial biogenesis protein FimT